MKRKLKEMEEESARLKALQVGCGSMHADQDLQPARLTFSQLSGFAGVTA